MDNYHQYRPLTESELGALYLIAIDMRARTKHMVRSSARDPIAAAVARRAGVKPSTALRALLALPDLRRPQPETFERVADAVARPDLADVWAARFKAAR